MTKALVAGAGIGGLASALALSRKNFSVDLYERSEALAEFGAGLQLSPNATKILRKLGAFEQVEAHAISAKGISVFRSDGALLTRLPLEHAEQRWGAPYWMLHRADLQKALAAVAQKTEGIKMHFGQKVSAAHTEPDGVFVEIGSKNQRTRTKGDLLIGADGLRSLIRDSLLKNKSDKVFFTGQLALRALVPAAKAKSLWLEPEICLHMGRNAHVVHYPLRGGEMVNVVAAIRSTPDDQSMAVEWDGEIDTKRVSNAFDKFDLKTIQLIMAAENWCGWPLRGHPPLKDYAYGRIALVGDSAHPMVPYLAQGAAQALEDAGALLDLDPEGDIEAGLAAYSRLRVPRANKVKAKAQAQAEIYHLSPLLAPFRDFALRLLGGERLLGRYEWLYGE